MRGGARAGAGRKAVLSWKQRIHIGAECDNYQREQRIGKAMARFDKQPAQVALKAARENLKGKTAKGVARLVKTEIAPLVRAVGGAVRVPLRREKTRAEIIKLVSDHCIKKLGLRGVTPRRVEACWKDYRAFLNSARISKGAEG